MESEKNVLKGKTVGNLFDFLSRSADLGVISQSLSAHLRAAVKKIFVATCSQNEFWRDVPLVSVELVSRIDQLRQNNHGECSDETIYVYQKRYERALRLYLESLSSDDSSFNNSPSDNLSTNSSSSSNLSSDDPSSSRAVLENLLAATSASTRATLFALLSNRSLAEQYRVFAADSVASVLSPKVGYFVLPSDLSPAELSAMVQEISSLLVALTSDALREKGD
ncbi:hypothetical protein IJI72_02670 [Candidatus Saccharibacteria bacterium]|nr:hypothetical protein [Candidatus Saccharibacteria bacterium]